MIRDYAEVLEKALLYEEQLDHAIFILGTIEAQKLYSELKKLLDQKAVTTNLTDLTAFIHRNESRIKQLFKTAQSRNF